MIFARKFNGVIVIASRVAENFKQLINLFLPIYKCESATADTDYRFEWDYACLLVDEIKPVSVRVY